MTSKRSTLHALLFTLFWLCIAAAGFFVIAQIAADYLTNVSSLQEFRWNIAQLDLPADNSERTAVVLEVQNQSKLSMNLKELEIYLLDNNVTVGKTYGRFEPLLIHAGETARVSFVFEITPSFLRDAKAEAHGTNQWRVTGTYKISTPLVDNDFFYHLNIPWLTTETPR